MPRGRNQKVSAKEIFEICQLNSREPFGAQEISQELPIGEERTRERLNSLAEDGFIGRKKIGGRNVYWIQRV